MQNTEKRAVKIERYHMWILKCEEAEEKIRGKRKPCWDSLVGDGVVNTRVGKESRKKAQNRWRLMEKLDSREWMCDGIERKVQSEQRRKK